MQDIMITKSEDEQHVYVHDTINNKVKSYQLLKCISKHRYVYSLSHTFSNYIKGMFGKEIEVKDNVENLGHNLLYIAKLDKKFEAVLVVLSIIYLLVWIMLITVIVLAYSKGGNNAHNYFMYFV